MRNQIKVLTTSLVLSSAFISCSTLASPDWRYVEGGYTQLDWDNGGDFEPDGLMIGSKYLLNNNVYLNGEFAFFEEGPVDINTLTLGAGYRLPLNASTDAYFGANFERWDSDGGDDSGYSLNAGVRSMITQQLELAGEVGYYDVNDGETTIKLGANYYFSPQWAAGFSYEMIDELDIVQATVRYSF